MNLSAGTIELHTSIVLGPGEKLSGMGPDKTIINYHGTFDAFQGPGCAVVLSDDSVVENLRINCVNQQHYAACLGCRDADGDAPFQGSCGRNLHLCGITDMFYIRHGIPCSFLLEDSITETKWDLIVLAGAMHEVTFKRCRGIANANNFIISQSQQEASCSLVVGGGLTLDHCYLEALGPMNTYGLATLGSGYIGHVPGSYINAIACSVKAKTPIKQTENSIITTQGCRFLKIHRNLTEPPSKDDWTTDAGLVTWKPSAT